LHKILETFFFVTDYFQNHRTKINPEGKRPLGRPKSGWVDNIQMDLSEIRWDGMDWIDVAQDRGQWRALVNILMNLQVP
jgi:hypothetical protein